MGKVKHMLFVLLVPGTLALILALLVVADALERRSSLSLVRSSLRSPVSCELTEAIIAANLAPRLEAAGLGRDEHEGDGEEDAAGVTALRAEPASASLGALQVAEA
ncbi:MAG TPA: hypothetical protein VMN58_08925 [Acidimicrobiales bacterium]|nr:hypothetical protein [Acidimicrobiales bacterium]